MEKILEQLLVYGPLGVFCCYFLIQDSVDRKINREVMKSIGDQLNEISKNQQNQETRICLLERDRNLK